jgi:hypothetical protein
VFVCLAAAEDAPSAPELGCCCGRRRDDDEEEEEEEEEGKNTAMSVPYQPRLLPRRAILRSNRRKIMLVSSLCGDPKLTCPEGTPAGGGGAGAGAGRLK